MKSRSSSGRSKAPYWFILAVAVHILVWTAWLTFAGLHPVAVVPLVK